MKKTLLRVLILTISLAMMAGMVACTAGAEPTSTPSQSSSVASTTIPDAEAPSANVSEAVTLSFMHFSTEEEEIGGNAGAASFRNAIKEWEAANPNVTLEQSILANDEFKPKIATLAGANDLPDVFVMQGMNTKAWAADGLVLEMSDVVNSAPWASKYDTNFFAPFKDDSGNLYAIPILAVGTCTIVAYDSQLWADAGYATFPEKWEDVVQASEYFKGLGVDTIAFGNSGKWQINSCWLSAVGDRFTGGDWFWSIINKSGAAFTDQAFVDSLKFTQDAFMSGVFNKDFNAVNNEDAREYYLAGSAAAFIGGNWDISHIQTNANPDLKARTKFAVIPQPTGATATTKTHAAGLGFGIAINPNLSGDKLEAAKSLATYTTGPAFSNYLAANFAQTAACAADAVDMSAFDQFTIDVYNFYENPNCEIYDSYMDGPLVDVMNTAIQEMLNGDKTPEQVAQESQQMYESLK